MNTEVKKIFLDKKIEEKLPRISSNIKRDRRWYWLHKQVKSHQKVSDLDIDSTGNRDTVIKAINQYKKKLGV